MSVSIFSCTESRVLKFYETQCANPWNATSGSPNYETTITNYLNTHDITPSNFEIINVDSLQSACAACQCYSGKLIRIHVSDAEVPNALAIGFIE